MSKIARHIFMLLLFAVAACGFPEAPSSDESAPADAAGAALAPPPGTQAGEPYRFVGRRWRSPLGLTVVSYGVAVDGVPVYGHHAIEIHDDAGQLVHRAGTGDAVLAELHGRGAAVWASWRHPRRGMARRAGRVDPLAHVSERAVWHYAGGGLVPAVATDRLNLLGKTPVGAVTVTNAVTGAVLAGHSTIFEAGGAAAEERRRPRDPDYLVYARADGRPFTSPLGNTLPHPTGVPDGSVPGFVDQTLQAQRTTRHSLRDPWLPAGATETRGNNVVAFFDSLINQDGIFVDIFDENGNETPEYGPEPDEAGHDFFAHPTDNQFAFPYDPTNTVAEYFQDGFAGDPMPFPDPADVALNAKIVATFYSANWLHDVFYRAGFDEVAGNAQESNLGRGGVEGDPLIVHAGFLTTFTFPGSEGVSPVLDLGLNSRSASRRDQGIDFSTMSHEWGHYLIGRLAGGTDISDAMGNLQGLSLHEGIADFVSVLVNYNDGDDPHATFAVGSYGNLDYIERRPTLPPVEAPADAMYFGIRRYPYSLDAAKNPLTLRHLAVPPPADQPYYNWKGRGPILNEVHTAGEVFAEALFACFGNIALAHPHGAADHNRTRMAEYLVAGLAAFPDRPSMLDARNAILAVVRQASPHVDYPACRAGFASRGMGAGALGPDREFGSDPDVFPPPDYDPADITESYVDADRAVHVVGSTFMPGAGSAIRVDLRNTGLVDLRRAVIAIRPAVAAAVAFPDGARAELAAIAPEDVATASVAAVVTPCALPADPAQPGSRAFDYTVDVTSPGRDAIRVSAAFHSAIAATCPAP